MGSWVASRGPASTTTTSGRLSPGLWRSAVRTSVGVTCTHSSATPSGMPIRAAVAAASGLTRAVGTWPAEWRARAAATVVVPWPPLAPVMVIVRGVIALLR